MSNLPIEGVIVQHFQSDALKKIITIELSDSNGEIMFTSVGNQDSLFFITSHLQYNIKNWAMSTSDCNPCILKLPPEKFQLPEINVIAKDQGIRVINDTIRFDLNVFKNKSQKDLADLLENLPGLEIREGGEILYNNKKIDKILLSGRDVINSQFDMANRLIRKDIVETVQIVPGKRTNENEVIPQYLDIVLAKDYQVLSEVGFGISHEARTEQNGSILLAGDRPMSSYFNFVRKSLDQPALSGGDALRKKDIDINIARTKLLGSSSEFLFSDVFQQGVNLNDILLQVNTKIDKNKYQASAYIDYRYSTHTMLSQSETVNPVSNLKIGSNNDWIHFSRQSISAYTKHFFEWNSQHSILSYLSFDYSDSTTDEIGFSQFLNNNGEYETDWEGGKQNYVWYNAYNYTNGKKIEVKIESDLSYHQDKKSTFFLSSDSLFVFDFQEENRFVVGQDVKRTAINTVIQPAVKYLMNEEQNIGLYGKYDHTHLKDNALLLQDAENSTFNTNTKQDVFKFGTRLFYNYRNKKSKFRGEVGYDNLRSRINTTDKEGTIAFLLRYNYKFTPKVLWSNTLSRSIERFSNEELYTSVKFLDNRSYSQYTSLTLPSYLQWNVTSVFRYLNTANAKIGIVSFNYSKSSSSLAPLIVIEKNAQLVQYVEAGSTNQFHVKGIMRWPIGASRLTANFSSLFMNSYVLDESGSQEISNINQSIQLTYKMNPFEDTDIKVGVDYNILNQKLDAFTSSFTTVSPSLEWRQFLKPKLWLSISYLPLIRIDFEDQHVIDCSLSTKFFKEKLTIELKVVDLLNFNNPQFIQRSISSDFIQETISTRVGGFGLLSASYQFQ